MTLEAQCRAMAEDNDFKPGQIISYGELKQTIDKYLTRDAVVEAIRKKAESNPDFKYEFQGQLHVILEKKHKTIMGMSFLMSICDESDLREAYLRASGLWVDEEKADPRSQLNDKLNDLVIKTMNAFDEALDETLSKNLNAPKEEEVDLPTWQGAHNKWAKHQPLTALEEFIRIHYPSRNNYVATSPEVFEMKLKSLIAEVRRGR